MKMIIFILLAFTLNAFSKEVTKCKKEKLCLSSKEEKLTANHTDYLDWIGPKNKIEPGLKIILQKLHYIIASSEENYIEASTNENSPNKKILIEFNFLEKSKTIEVKISSDNVSLNKADLSKRLEEIKFKYFQREFN